MALRYSCITVDIREVVLRDKPPCMLQFSPKGTVPVLVLGDGTVIDESMDIIYWALQKNDPTGLLAGLNSTQMDSAKQLIAHNDGPFKACLDRYKYADRYSEKNQEPHSQEYHRQQCEVFLKTLDQCLQRHCYLLGGALSMADVAIFPFIRQFAFVDKEWFDQNQYRHLQAWLACLLSSAQFTESMVKLAPWREGDRPIVFPDEFGS